MYDADDTLLERRSTRSITRKVRYIVVTIVMLCDSAWVMM
jgi:hypothetical protein